MKKLIVAEKPSVGRDIARVLGIREKGDGYLYGDHYVVTWAIGHLVSLCEPGEFDERYKRWSMALLPMLPQQIPLKVLPDTRGQFLRVSKLMNSPKIDSVICATDSAREGELIFRYIYQMAGCRKPVERLWISSMTDEAIRQGFQQLKPSSAYDALYESARCRSEADWLIGMNASRAFSLRYDAHLSVGRVQTPTLALLVRRDREIESFQPRNYWEVRASFGDYEGLWINPDAPPEDDAHSDAPADKKNARDRSPETRVYSLEQAESIRDAVRGRPARVEESLRERKRTPPPQLYDLTGLQQDANQKYGFSADKTLKLAQALYETHKLITYPRTDSRYLPDDMKPRIRKVLQRMPQPYSDLIASDEIRLDMCARRFYDNGKISDHHAIVPTEKPVQPGGLSVDENRLYDMIARRLIAAHYPDYEYESGKIITRVDQHRFKSTGVIPLRSGWKAVYRDDERDRSENPLPCLRPGDLRRVERVHIKSDKTRPPKPHTDASLLGMMENAGRDIEDEELREQLKSSGLGTPATRAQIIERLIQVGYARRSGKTLRSTEKGCHLIDAVPPQIASAVTTGKWEKALSEMASYADAATRAAKSDRFMSGIRRFAEFLVDAARQSSAEIRFEKETPPKKPRGKSSSGRTKSASPIRRTPSSGKKTRTDS